MQLICHLTNHLISQFHFSKFMLFCINGRNVKIISKNLPTVNAERSMRSPVNEKLIFFTFSPNRFRKDSEQKAAILFGFFSDFWALWFGIFLDFFFHFSRWHFEKILTANLFSVFWVLWIVILSFPWFFFHFLCWHS